MRKQKKRLSALMAALVCLTMLASTLPAVVNSVPTLSAATERTGISFEVESTNGLKHPTGYYYAPKPLEEIPVTFEAWVYIPSAQYSGASAVISNYLEIGTDEFFDFCIQSNGIPTLYVGKGLSANYATFSFSNAKVPADTWTHVSVVYGTGTDGKQAFCYINGELKHQSAVGDYAPMTEGVFENTVCLGGDLRSFNQQWFKGELGEVRVYADVRDASEIAADMTTPADCTDPELIMCYELSSDLSGKNVADKSANGYDMLYGEVWLTEEEMEQERARDKHAYTYSMAVLPDPQYSTESYPKSLAAEFDYLLNNASAKNIQYVLGVGDMTNNNTEAQWANITAQTARLNGKLPYTVIRGNHDTTYNGFAELFDQNYADPNGYYYKHVQQNGGFYNSASVKNTYLLFEVGSVKYLLLNLDFGADDNVLAWADGVLSAHPDRRVIATTHGYLDADGTTLDDHDAGSPSVNGAAATYNWNSGEDMWNELFTKHANVHMVICGHIQQDDVIMRTRKGDAGNTVYQFLIDTQTADAKIKGGGFVAMLYFTADGNNVRVECYSTVHQKYFRSTSNLISFAVGSEYDPLQKDDHTCDNCTGTLCDCVDADKDHKCDLCGAIMGAHTDVAPKDHKCDYGCKEVFSACVDRADDRDHVCDYGCGKPIGGDCTNNDGDQNCDVCGKKLSDNAAGSVVGLVIGGQTVTSSADYIAKMGYAAANSGWTAVATPSELVTALGTPGAKVYLTQDVDFKSYTGYLNGGANVVQIANGVTVDGCGFAAKNITLSGSNEVYPFWYKGTDPLTFKNFRMGTSDAKVKVTVTAVAVVTGFLYANVTGTEITIDNVAVFADIVAPGNTVAGFFTARNTPVLTIRNSEMNGSITVEGEGRYGTGGFVTNTIGTMTIENCVNNATITARACGGIFGWSAGGTVLIRNCVNNGTINCTVEDIYYSLGTHCASQRGTFTVENTVNLGKVTNVVNGSPVTTVCPNYGDHADNDQNHVCDNCVGPLTECADEDSDHLCDVCEAKLSDCKDDDNDHLCDVCETKLGDCKDDDNNHLCDVCETKLGDCKDEDSDHLCDVCNTKFGDCKDEDNDHLCDVCDGKLGDCTDSNADGRCDICDGQMPGGGGNTVAPDKPQSGLGAGAIIGIVVGGVAVLGLGGFALVWFVIKKKSFADLIAGRKKK